MESARSVLLAVHKRLRPSEVLEIPSEVELPTTEGVHIGELVTVGVEKCDFTADEGWSAVVAAVAPQAHSWSDNSASIAELWTPSVTSAKKGKCSTSLVV